MVNILAGPSCKIFICCHLEEEMTVSRTRRAPELLLYSDVPGHLRFNKYVYSHYRPPLDTLGCITSLTYWHNETINILTHALPAIFIWSMIPWMLPWNSITIPWLPWTHVTACLAPWVGSTLYHLFMCHRNGQAAYNLLLKVDLLGIWFTQTLGALVNICAAIYCFHPETQAILCLHRLGPSLCFHRPLHHPCGLSLPQTQSLRSWGSSHQ